MRHRFYFSASHHVVVVVPKLAVAVTIIESSCRTNKTKCGFGGCMKTRMKIHSILTRKPYNTRSGYTYTRQAASLAMMGYDILSKHTKGRRICQFFRWSQKLDRNSNEKRPRNARNNPERSNASRNLSINTNISLCYCKIVSKRKDKILGPSFGAKYLGLSTKRKRCRYF